MKQKVKIFLFHRVSPDRDIMWPPIDPILFHKIIKYISRNYVIFTVEDLFLGKVENISNIKRPIACITFDDGYRDFIQYALPILDKFKVKASMYVVTDSVISGLPPWTFIIDFLLINAKKNDLFTIAKYSNLSYKEFSFDDIKSKIKFNKILKNEMKKMLDSQRKSIYNFICQTINYLKIPDNLMMNKAEIIQIKNAGITIGSHTKSHPLLAKIENENDIIYELKESSQVIQQIIGEPPITISYPVGSYNPKVIELAIKTEYKLGLAVEQKPFKGIIQTNFAIPRIELYNENYFKSLLRIAGTIENIKKIIKT